MRVFARRRCCPAVHVVFALTLALTFTARPLPAAADPEAPHIARLAQTGGIVQSLAVDGNRACAGVGAQLVVLDVAQPDSPRELGRSEVLAGMVSDCAIRGDDALALTVHALHAFSVAGGLPVPTGRLDLPGEAWEMSVAGDLAAVIGPAGLAVLALQPDGPPALVAVAPDVVGNAIALSGSMAVVGHDEGIQIVDMADPAHPRARGSLLLQPRFTSYAALAVAWAGSTVLASTEDFLAVVDASDLDQPRIAVDWFELPYVNLPWGLEVTAEHIYAIGRWEVLRFDRARLPNLGNWAPHGIELDSEAVAAAAVGDRLLVATWAGLETLDVGDLRGPELLGRTPVAGGAADLALHDGRLLALTREPGGLTVLDRADPARPAPLATLPLGGMPFALAVAGDLAYVAAGEAGLHVVDLSAPAAPRLVTTLPVPGSATGLTVAEGVAVIGTMSADLRVVDLADPRRPRFAGEVAGGAMGLALSGRRLLAVSESLRVVDLADLAAPRVVATLATGEGACVLTLPGDLAYVCGTDKEDEPGLYVVDLASPAQPRIERFVPFIDQPESLAMAADYLWVAMTPGEPTIWSVADPRRPVWRWEPEEPALDRIVVTPDGAWAYGTAGSDVATIRGGLKAMVPTGHWGQAMGIVRAVAAAPGGALAIRSPRCCFANWLQGYRRQADGALLPGESAARDYGALALAGSGDALALLEPYSADDEDWARLATLDPARPGQPSVLGEIDLEGEWRRLAVSAGQILVANGHGLLRLDTRDPARPLADGELDLMEPVRGLALDGGYGYVVTGDNRLVTVDARSGVSMTLLAGAPLPPESAGVEVRALAVAAGRAYVTLGTWSYEDRGQGTGLAVFDVTRVNQPRFLELIEAPNATGVAAEGFNVLLTTDQDLRWYTRSVEGLRQLAAVPGPIMDGPVALLGNHFVVAAGASGLTSGELVGPNPAARLFLPCLGR